MKTLTLIIKQKWFDEIIAGRKKEEYRDCKPTTESRYIETDADGYAVLDENGVPVLKKYDAIRFYVGYAKDRDSALVEVKGARIEDAFDEKGDLIEYAVVDGQYFDLKMLNAMRKTEFKPGELTKSDERVKQLADNLLIDDPEDGFAINDEWADAHPEVDFWSPGIVTYELGEILEKKVKG